MGHERIGFLPRSNQWKRIVAQLASYDGDSNSIKQITEDTLQAIKYLYEKMPFDESVIKAVSFLASLSFSAKQENPVDYLNANGYTVDSNISLFSLILSAQNLITTEKGSLEINKLAKDAVLQAIIDYQQEHSSDQLSFWGEPNNIWKSIGTGAAFCELARSFFAVFTYRHLKYYLDRSAASSIGDYAKLQMFSKQLSEHTKAISDHTFDISKIMQSFAAGWFNKNVVKTLPDKKKLRGFLNHSFCKLREEFRRESEDK